MEVVCLTINFKIEFKYHLSHNIKVNRSFFHKIEIIIFE